MKSITRKAAIATILATLLSGRSISAPTTQPGLESAPAISPEDQKVEDLLDHRLPSVQLPSVSLADSIDFIRDITGANIYVDWQAVELAGVTKNNHVEVSATNIPVRQVFKKILEGTGVDSLEIQVIQGTIVVSTKLNFADRKAQKGPYLPEFSDALKDAGVLDERMAMVQLPAVPLTDAIDFLRDISSVPLLVKWKPLAAAGVDKTSKISLSLHDAKISTILYFLLDQVGDGKLGYVTEPIDDIVYDPKLKVRVKKRTELITISTIDDLVASKAKATTQPN